MHLTVLICTHDRSSLLARVLASINQAERPASCRVELLVVANACSDDTVQRLRRYDAESERSGALPLRWTEEPTPGKSHALNRGLGMIAGGLVAFVDDDHRVDRGYFANLVAATSEYPQASLFCGRILPDWDGSEPAWVHDTGPYRIYPLPVPRYDAGEESCEITSAGPAPGGGNLCVRREVFDRVGGFSTDLGPRGHDLGGGEDADFVYRCLAAGERIRYVPSVLQYHYVDPERLRLGYLLRKSFQRSRSGVRAHARPGGPVPLYLWRKLATYLALGFLSLSWPRTRFFAVRCAAALGELRGFLDKATDRRAPGRASVARTAMRSASWILVPAFVAALALIGSSPGTRRMFAAALLVALLVTGALLVKSFYDFTQTGPPLRREVLRNYRTYSVFALLRLAIWTFVFGAVMAALGVVIYAALSILASRQMSFEISVVAAILGVLAITGLQFCRHLLYLPASIAASSHYRASRLYPLWRTLGPARIEIVKWIGGTAASGLLAVCAWALVSRGAHVAGAGFALLALIGPLAALARFTQHELPAQRGMTKQRPNILMIGSDTLRADRVGTGRYPREVAPFIDSLARSGTLFGACYVPCARTAPSLLSLLTGTWPWRHRVRDNFVGDEETRLSVPALPELFARHGYRTAAVSDWCGGDLGKFPLGFEIADLPKDQWNVKYLIRQGPKDLRLFLSLFTHNAFGKWFLPELYYLAGVPLTSLVGRDARALISRFAERGEPFFLNVFMSTTHPPFGSEYPYYTLYLDRKYAGESKFVMSRLTDPWEIIRRQADTRKDFDLDQVIDLYDGCVRNFDDEVKRIVEHLGACGLAENTIVVLYSDHGMEFFEHGTWGQGNSVRGDASARVPLVIADPRIKGTAACSRVVRSIDVAPTLLELAGIGAPADMDGVSLVPYLKGEAVDLDLAAYNETGIWLTTLPGMPEDHLRYPDLFELLEVPDRVSGTLAIKPEYRDIVIRAKDRMIRRGRWKLTCQPTTSGPRYALFDLAMDPECRDDVASVHIEIVRALQERLADWSSGKPMKGGGEQGDKARSALPAIRSMCSGP